MKREGRSENPLLTLVRHPSSAKGTLHTPSEIWNQCSLWTDTARRLVEGRAALIRFLGSRARDEIILTGAGSSYLVGKSLISIIKDMHSVRTLAIPSTDLVTHYRGLLPRRRTVLMVSLSRSGDTPESVRAIELALKEFPRIVHWIITCNPEGLMVRKFRKRKEVFVTVLNPRTCDRGLAMTSSVTNMFWAALFLALSTEPDWYRDLVAQAAGFGKRILEVSAGIALALGRKKLSRVALIGSGPLHAAALEGALKITELTDGAVATLGESYLGIRHGPLTFIDGRTLVMYFLSSDPKVHPYEVDLIRQVRRKRLGACLVAVGGESAGRVTRYVDHVVDIGTNMDEGFAVPLFLLFPQMVGLFSSLTHGLKPDYPSRRGVIHRVVRGVKFA